MYNDENIKIQMGNDDADSWSCGTSGFIFMLVGGSLFIFELALKLFHEDIILSLKKNTVFCTEQRFGDEGLLDFIMM